MSMLNFQTKIQKLPLFLGGILLIYLAVADESLFNNGDIMAIRQSKQTA